jgi:hypothetical protein
MVRSSWLVVGQIAEVVCIGADVLAYYETSNKLLFFLLVFLQTPSGLIMRLKKDWSRLGL